MTENTWHMHAYLEDDGRLTTVGRKFYVELHGFDEPIVPVLVEEIAEDDDSVTHWGWMESESEWRKADTEPHMIWGRYLQFEMCFPYGVNAEVEARKGRVVRLRVTQEAEASE